MKEIIFEKIKKLIKKENIATLYTAFLVIFSFILVRRYVDFPVSLFLLFSGAGILLIGDYKKRVPYLIVLALFTCFERHFILQYSACFQEIGHQALITLHITDPDEIRAYLKIFKTVEYILPLFFIAGIGAELYFKSPSLCHALDMNPPRSYRVAAGICVILAMLGMGIWEIGMPVAEYAKIWKEQGAFYQKRADFKFFAESADKDPLFTLLIIGESHRKDEFDRFVFDPAYSKAPALLNAKKKGNLWTFDDVISHYQQTWFSVFTLLCRRGNDAHNVLWPEKGLIGLFNEAGFKTHFFNYQDRKPSQMGYHFYVNEADTYTNHRTFSDTKFDHGMLAPLARVMKEKVPKQLVVAKMIGTHFHYTSRYPRSYELFKPCYGEKLAKSEYRIEDKELLVNTYRNAMAFSVTFLDEAAKLIEASPTPAVMVFLSDHGVVNYDDGKNTFFGAAKSNFLLPCIVLVNDAYRKKLSADTVKAMEKNRLLPATNSFIFETMASLAGIKYKGQRPEMDLSSPLARPALKREVWVVKQKLSYDSLP